MAVVLAAGRGIRMRSALPKVLHPVGGRSMLRLVCDSVAAAGFRELVVVTPDAAGAVATSLRDGGPLAAQIAPQGAPLGTGHAALAARALCGEAPRVMILNADLPLLTARTLRELARRHEAAVQPLTFLTAHLDDPSGYGRVLRRDGRVTGVVEEREADTVTRREREVNAGLYAADAVWLWPVLEQLEPAARGERYLTDLVRTAVESGRGVQAFQVHESSEVQQVNSRLDLARADGIMRERVRRQLLLDGVTLVDPATTYIDVGVRVGADTTLLPGVHLLGATTIGGGCRIGPNAVLRDMRVGEGCEIGGSTLEGSTIADAVTVGPYCHVRSGSTIEREVHLGNFAEVKASRLGARTLVGHFSYIGDADVGEDVNIGAGTVTSNFDGKQKHHTRIGARAFIGSDSILVAPIEIGADASTGAGSVVTHDVAPGVRVMGVPARLVPAWQGAGSP
ncbi:MAG: UDP-N-acetylglucosamine diphosphorylase/glucosamine-1-phosphate N-acetyltransferase [Dehalococcoidia bacterium]|nr:UDP-N-acetylglucosamine diphosphorylase/glucosamine-1-phosphate N-acetyltransferase [Dehalococcoidia bacterium]